MKTLFYLPDHWQMGKPVQKQLLFLKNFLVILVKIHTSPSNVVTVQQKYDSIFSLRFCL